MLKRLGDQKKSKKAKASRISSEISINNTQYEEGYNFKSQKISTLSKDKLAIRDKVMTINRVPTTELKKEKEGIINYLYKEGKIDCLVIGKNISISHKGTLSTLKAILETYPYIETLNLSNTNLKNCHLPQIKEILNGANSVTNIMLPITIDLHMNIQDLMSINVFITKLKFGTLYPIQINNNIRVIEHLASFIYQKFELSLTDDRLNNSKFFLYQRVDKTPLKMHLEFFYRISQGGTIEGKDKINLKINEINLKIENLLAKTEEYIKANYFWLRGIAKDQNLTIKNQGQIVDAKYVYQHVVHYLGKNSLWVGKPATLKIDEAMKEKIFEKSLSQNKSELLNLPLLTLLAEDEQQKQAYEQSVECMVDHWLGKSSFLGEDSWEGND